MRYVGRPKIDKSSPVAEVVGSDSSKEKKEDG
jgi:hypothetical protein